MKRVSVLCPPTELKAGQLIMAFASQHLGTEKVVWIKKRKSARGGFIDAMDAGELRTRQPTFRRGRKSRSLPVEK
jgi:hypothetical protein